MGTVIYGSELSAEMREDMKQKIASYIDKGFRAPCLAVILVGDNPASVSYVTGKEKACKQVGITSKMIHMPADASQEQLQSIIVDLSSDASVDGILVQLPLPKGLNEDDAIQCIDPAKDVDGLHLTNTGLFYSGEDCFVPCTPMGVMELLRRMNCDPDGKHAVVVGRSKLVGMPVARLLLNANATVTTCHSHTKNLGEITRQADILIAAAGRPRMIKASDVKEGAYVIDVGVNRVDGHLCGDVDFDDVKDKAAAITPVPRGVGPMTITMLLQNTIRSYEERVIHND